MRRAERAVHLLPEEFQFQKSASVFPISSRDSVKDFPAMGPARREGSGMVLTAWASRTAMESQEATRWLWSRGVHRGCPASGTARPRSSVNARGIGANLSAFFFSLSTPLLPSLPTSFSSEGRVAERCREPGSPSSAEGRRQRFGSWVRLVPQSLRQSSCLPAVCSALFCLLNA